MREKSFVDQQELALVFPGQGSQSLGMLKELAASYAIIEACFSLVSERLGYDLWALVQEGPEERLNQTEYTQVAMLTADVAVYRLLSQLGHGKAQLMAGHSLGEYAALVCAGSLDLADAAWLVSQRGQLMQKYVPLGQGGMGAIVGLSDQEVEALCLKASTEKNQVVPANYNAPGQIVIAGHLPLVEKTLQWADEAGARLTKRLALSVPCHCPLLKEAAEVFEERLKMISFSLPKTSVISNVTAQPYQSVEEMRLLLKEHLFKPVQWVKTVHTMVEAGIKTVVEVGPGKVLSGLVKRIDKSLASYAVNDMNSLGFVQEKKAVVEN